MRLLTIPISHYCEKARWALDLAGIDYQEERHLQLMHRRPVRRAGGNKTVPVLCTGERVLCESHDILEFVDQKLGHVLFDAGGEAAKLEAQYDDFGVETRRIMYSHFLAAPALVHRYNNTGAPLWQRMLMRVSFRFIRPQFERYIDTSTDRLEKARKIVDRTFDDVERRLSDGRPYLLGDRFSAADLTFACMSAALVVPSNYGTRLPPLGELPKPTYDLVSSYRSRPGGKFALKLFAVDRPTRR